MTQDGPIIYQISIKEQLAVTWAEWFAPLHIWHTATGETLLSGPVRDQAELFGLLLKVYNLNLTLVAVRQVPAATADPASTPESIL